MFYTDKTVQRQVGRFKLNMRVIKPVMDKLALAEKREKSLAMKKRNRRPLKNVMNIH